MTISKKLMEILACPKCKGQVSLEENDRIVCRSCRLAYPVKDDIPVMLIEEARNMAE